MKGWTVKNILSLRPEWKLDGLIEEKRPLTGYAFDSRQLERGMLFFALKGDKVDGHDFLREVAQKGALAAVVSKGYQGGAPEGLPLIRVEDVLTALQLIASHSITERGSTIIGVTGSVGKTTTKEFIATLLSQRFRVGKSYANANSQAGLPVTILNNDPAEILVLEMGMNAPGQIKRLTTMAPPDLAVITQIGHAHIGFFEDGLEGIAREKAEILAHSKTKCAVLPLDAKKFKVFADHKVTQEISFSASSPLADYYYLRERDKLVFFERGVKCAEFSLSLTASHLIYNLMPAIAVCRKMGMEWEELEKGVGYLHGFMHRYEMKEREGICFIDDSYNASFESILCALNHLPHPQKGGKRVAVIGEMGELGSHSVFLHTQVAECALPMIDHLICYGKGCLPMVELFHRLERRVDYFEEFKPLKTKLQEVARPGDVVLIKGSNSKQLWRLLEEV